MTTSPVVSVTDELVAELEARYALSAQIGDDLLYTSRETIRALLAERAELLRDRELWHPIHDEVDRRADKEWCLSSKCDFTVTVFYEDYAAIDAAMTMQEQPT